MESNKYYKIKSIIERVNSLDCFHHTDIYNILKKYNLKFSKNNNGFFFDFENVSDEAINELFQYFEVNEQRKNATSNMRSEIETENENNVDEKHANNNEVKDTTKSQKESKKNSTFQECVNMIDGVMLPTEPRLNVSTIWSQIEKDKTYIVKKNSLNKFNVAKKKFSKQFCVDIKRQHVLMEMLDYEEPI
jgi:alpha-galactosidase/6-phospho-beta-glucosidase family protein